MTTQALERAEFRTPGGHGAVFSVRPETSDWNTCNAITAVGDEYHLPRGLSGWALDVGAHIGACTVALLLDNPDLQVVAIEALPENVALLRENLRANGVEDRCIVVEGAAGDGLPATIFYGDTSTDFGRAHEFIGNADGQGRRVSAEGVSLIDVIADRIGQPYSGRFVWAKIDCEGCEYPFLSSKLVGRIDVIEGEVHRGWDRLVDILSPTHDVTGEGKDFGAFRAVRR